MIIIILWLKHLAHYVVACYVLCAYVSLSYCSNLKTDHLLFFKTPVYGASFWVMVLFNRPQWSYKPYDWNTLLVLLFLDTCCTCTLVHIIVLVCELIIKHFSKCQLVVLLFALCLALVSFGVFQKTSMMV